MELCYSTCAQLAVSGTGNVVGAVPLCSAHNAQMVQDNQRMCTLKGSYDPSSVHFHISPLAFQLQEPLPTQTCLEFISLSQFLALFLLFPLKELEFLGFRQGIKHLFCSAVTISKPTWFIWKEWWPYERKRWVASFEICWLPVLLDEAKDRYFAVIPVLYMISFSQLQYPPTPAVWEPVILNK